MREYGDFASLLDRPFDLCGSVVLHSSGVERGIERRQLHHGRGDSREHLSCDGQVEESFSLLAFTQHH